MSARDRRRSIGAAIAASAGMILMSLAGWQAASAANVTATSTATLTVVGEPLVAVFTPSSPTMLDAEWTVSAVSSAALDADGVLLPTTADAEGELARDLRVWYGTDVAGDVFWHDGGTLADAVSYGAAVGHGLVVRPGEDTIVHVRVSYDGDWSWAHSTSDYRRVEARFLLTAPAPIVDDQRDSLPRSGGSLQDTGVLAALLGGLLLLTVGGWWLGVARRGSDEEEHAETP